MVLTPEIHSVDGNMKLSEIAAATGGVLAGDGDIEIEGVAHPLEAEGPAILAMAMEDELVDLLAKSPSRAAVVLGDAHVPDGAVDGYVAVGRARVALGKVTDIFERPVHAPEGVHASAVIDESAIIGEGVSIGPLCVVGPNARIGDGTVLMAHVTIGADAVLGNRGLIHPGVRIGERVHIGDRFIIHHNASIGSDGFSFVTPEPGSVESVKGRTDTTEVEAQNLAIWRINSIGSVAIGGHVEIGASTTIDRGTISDTRIGSHTKIDNLVQIGHNVVIGDNCMICGQVGVAGSVTIGDRVVLAGQVGVADHLTIGSDVVVGGGSGVGTDLEGKTVYVGYPALPRDEAVEQYLNTRRLGHTLKDIRRLKSRVKALETEKEKG
jgi:UDP-3-O-[3-hydroxymyristoyl] glucosamine N-acyltransferase